MDDTSNRTSTLIFGGVLILIGLIFLVQNLTDFRLGNWNWWALFILIPAIGSLSNVWRIYQTNGRVTAAARGSLVFGLAMLLVATILMFNLSWSVMWPFFLIVFGIGALIAR
jgi:hypothetical protein